MRISPSLFMIINQKLFFLAKVLVTLLTCVNDLPAGAVKEKNLGGTKMKNRR